MEAQDITDVRQGQIEAINKVIVELMPLAMKLAAAYIRRCPRNKDMYVSAALFGLVQGVNWFATRSKDDNIIPYLIVTIRRFLWEALTTNPLIKEYKSLEYIDGLDEYIECVDEVKRTLTADELLAVNDYLESTGLPPMIIVIVKMRLDGYTLDEISRELGIPRTHIHRSIEKVRKHATQYLSTKSL